MTPARPRLRRARPRPGLLLLAAALGLASPASAGDFVKRAHEPPSAATEGVAALCSDAVTAVAPALARARSVALQVAADGAAEDLADALRGSCTAALLGLGIPSAPFLEAERVLRVRARVAPPVLAAVVEVWPGRADGTALAPAPATVASVQAPLGAALSAWLSAASAGLSTWIVGDVEGEVLALCGEDADGDGAAEVALVTAGGVLAVRWSASGLEPLARAELPPALAARARAPAASAACRVEGTDLVVAFGLHDRGRGAIAHLSAGRFGPLKPLEGVPAGFDAAGAPVLLQGVAGTPLVRWRERTLLAASAGPVFAAVGADGTPVLGESAGRPLTAGSGVAVADVDADGAPEIVRTRPVFPGPDATDRLVVGPLSLDAPSRWESAPTKGLLGALGVVNAGGRARVLAVRFADGRSQLHALGLRGPVEARK